MSLSIDKISSPELESPVFDGIFLNPAAAFQSLKGRPRWFYPLLIAAAYAVVVNLYVIEQVGFTRLLHTMLQNTATLDAQAVLDTALERKAQILFFQGLSTFVSMFVTTFVVSKVLWLVLEVIGEDLLFRRVLAVVAHATMLTTLIRESMLALTATVMRNPETLDLRNPLATNLAFFLHPGSPVTYRLLAALDLVTLGKICLLALGLSKVSDRLCLRGASLVVLVPWALYVGISLFFPGLF